MLALLIGGGLYAWRQQLVVRAPLLSIAFDHEDHGAVRCATCHHNFFDGTGTDSCYFCHKARRDLALRVQSDFHAFCRDCHVRIAALGKDSGPVSRCKACHAPADDEAPPPVVALQNGYRTVAR